MEHKQLFGYCCGIFCTSPKEPRTTEFTKRKRKEISIRKGKGCKVIALSWSSSEIIRFTLESAKVRETTYKQQYWEYFLKAQELKHHSQFGIGHFHTCLDAFYNQWSINASQTWMQQTLHMVAIFSYKLCCCCWFFFLLVVVSEIVFYPWTPVIVYTAQSHLHVRHGNHINHIHK